jgi:hypothetical protein
MSFTLELRGQSIGSWPLTTTCLEQIAKLRESGARLAIELLFGDDETQDGTSRAVPRPDLLAAVKEIAGEAKKIPGGFQMHRPSIADRTKSTLARGGISGLLIDGKYCWIRCLADHWIFEELREGMPEPVRRYDTAEIATENFGVIRVEPRKSARSDLFKLAHEVQKFLENDPSDEIKVIWG